VRRGSEAWFGDELPPAHIAFAESITEGLAA